MSTPACTSRAWCFIDELLLLRKLLHGASKEWKLEYGAHWEREMKITLIKSAIVGVGAAAALSAASVGAFAATPEERAKCEKMIKEMGAPAPHVHSADKGQGSGAMSAEHARCLAIVNEGKTKEK
jgi:hypothetical protein